MRSGRIGGHMFMTNIDPGALAYIAETLPIKTMIDVGCGPGGMIKEAEKLGITAYGIDGDPAISPDVLHHFDDGPLEVDKADLAWSIEFLEHINEKSLDNVFSVFKKCKYVFCTHNMKPGPFHQNCRPNEYWLEVFKNNGFEYGQEMTTQIKKHSTMEREFVRDTGTFFENKHHR